MTEPARPLVMAYADPPYFGCGARHYGTQHDQAHMWDSLDTHKLLIGRLCDDYPDGWALSASSNTLQDLLPLCPPGVRVGAWVKPFHALKRGVRPSYGWEPVIFRGGRNRGHKPPPKNGKATTPRDWVSAPITMRKGLTGAKPAAVCAWILDCLNLIPGDRLDDLFPGTGIMGHAVAQRLAQPCTPDCTQPGCTA